MLGKNQKGRRNPPQKEKKMENLKLTIKNLNEEQYTKIEEFAKKLVGKKYTLTIYHDDCIDAEEETKLAFENDGIEDVKIKNYFRRNYALCREYETDYFDEEELKAEGYHLFTLEAYEHSGVCIYEHSGSLHDKWDSGICGIVAIKGEYEIAYKTFKSFIEVWNKVSEGDFYRFEIEDNFGETIDNCGGFWDVDSIWEYLPQEITKEQFEEAKNNIQWK